MNKKIVKEYLIITFIIMILGWGTAAILSQTTELNLLNSTIIKILFVLGGFSPTIASFITLKKNEGVKNFKEWIKKIFDIKHKIGIYALIVLFLIIYFGIGCLLNDYKIGVPIFMQFLIVIIMLFGGGNEEAGWRMILQPELEKKYNFNTATIITGLIWWLWHLPIFFIKGSPNENINYFIFGIMCMSLSYPLAIIRKKSNGVFPCVLFHAFINSLTATFIFKFNIQSILIILLINIVLSNIILTIENKNNIENKKHIEN